MMPAAAMLEGEGISFLPRYGGSRPRFESEHHGVSQLLLASLASPFLS